LQLTSTPGAPESTREGGPSLWSRLDHPAIAGGIAFLGWLAYALTRWQVWAKGHLILFIVAGSGRAHGFTHPHQLPPGFMVADPNSAGYDGQFYYRLALNPFNWDKTAYGITMDQSYRYTRIGYPLLAWLFSFGQHDLVPAVLVALNLLGVAAMAYLGAMFAREADRHALWGLAFAAYFGLAISVGRDTPEPIAEACMLAGLLAYRRERWMLSGVAFAFGAITRETILFAPAAIAVLRLIAFARRKERPGLADVAWLAPAIAYGLDELAAKFVLKGQFPLAADTSRNLSTPFAAMIDGIRQDIAGLSASSSAVNGPHVYAIPLLEYATLFFFILAGLAVIVVTTAPLHERLGFVFFTLQLGLLSNQIWGSTFGDGRSLLEPFLFALILLLATPKRYLNTYRLAAITAVALPALAIVVRRRILYM
jgi:hypothetical protein